MASNEIIEVVEEVPTYVLVPHGTMSFYNYPDHTVYVRRMKDGRMIHYRHYPLTGRLDTWETWHEKDATGPELTGDEPNGYDHCVLTLIARQTIKHSDLDAILDIS